MNPLLSAAPLACAAALFVCGGCNKNDRTSETTPTGASNQDRNGASSNMSGSSSTPPSTTPPSPTPPSTGGDMTGSGMGGSGTSTIGEPLVSSDMDNSGMQTLAMRYERVTARITRARCDRELSCSQIGPNKHFATHELCTRETGTKTRDELTSSECPKGFDANKLAFCVASIGQQDCSDLLGPLQTVDTCKAPAVCAGSGQPAAR